VSPTFLQKGCRTSLRPLPHLPDALAVPHFGK
jgi:hypothetical protein